MNSPSTPNKNIVLDSDIHESKVLSSDSSQDDDNASFGMPTRKKLPFQISNNNKDLKKKKERKKNCLTVENSHSKINDGKSYSYLFSQPTEVDPLLALQNTDAKENIYKRKIVDSSPKIKMSMAKLKSKALRQTVLKFPKNTLDLERSILNNCETVSLQ